MAKAKIGVLFVHGIGEQRRGDTLTSTAEIWLTWLDRYLGQGRVVVERAELNEEASKSPSNAWVRIEKTPGQPDCLLLAESCWAEAFPPPSFGEIRRWLTVSGSWIATSHLLAGLQRRLAVLHDANRFATDVYPLFRWLPTVSPARLLRIVEVVMLTGVAVVLLPLLILVQLGMMLLYILSFVPFAGSAIVTQAALMLSRVLGDSFVFTARPIARAAVQDRVKRDLAWLAPQCEKVIVAAHSQGAHVASDLLFREAGAGVSLLITYGAGIRKLLELERMDDADWRIVLVTWLIAAGVLWIALILVGWAAGGPAPGWWAMLAAIPIAAAIPLALSVWKNLQHTNRQVEEELVKRAQGLKRAGCQWHDYWASHDPVPGGALRDRPFLLRLMESLVPEKDLELEIAKAELLAQESLEKLRKKGGWFAIFNEYVIDWKAAFNNLRKALAADLGDVPAGQIVRNELQIWADHTAYWESFDDFVPRFTNAVSQHGGFGWIADPAASIRSWAIRRAIRVWCRRVGWALVAVSALVCAWKLPHLPRAVLLWATGDQLDCWLSNLRVLGRAAPAGAAITLVEITAWGAAAVYWQIPRIFWSVGARRDRRVLVFNEPSSTPRWFGPALFWVFAILPAVLAVWVWVMAPATTVSLTCNENL